MNVRVTCVPFALTAMALAVGATGAAAEATFGPITTIPPTTNAPQTRKRLIKEEFT